MDRMFEWFELDDQICEKYFWRLDWQKIFNFSKMTRPEEGIEFQKYSKIILKDRKMNDFFEMAS